MSFSSLTRLQFFNFTSFFNKMTNIFQSKSRNNLQLQQVLPA
ncbi:hypothetical protein HMPREF0541_00930 [Lacticaseibacillus rhamnosus ATCC 21052]|nr:hypothetical protein HMPREF0541_00930 [Lacticaseibacillus rhamnosus ATCC 21052]